VRDHRTVEVKGALEHVPLGKDSIALDLGCGDGFATKLLRERFACVFSVDPDHAPDDGRSCFAFAVAEALPFRDCTFDLIFSSSVIEHLEDRPRGLDEAARVLQPGGYMVHIVPTRFWKAASLLLNPIGYPLRVAEKWRSTRKLAREGGLPGKYRSGGRLQPGIAAVLGRWFRPPIHGSYSSHSSEFRSYGRRHWSRLFNRPDLIRVAEVRSPCWTTFGFFRFRLIALRARLGSVGLNATLAFIMRKCSRNNGGNTAAGPNEGVQTCP
jgi:SAM-dependent methyltransferase